MLSTIIETKYPLTFRSDDAKKLGEHLKLRHSVELIGAKRVGISDFLRFFLFRRGIVEKYIDKRELHLFISVDLNDLVELELFPFWILTLKRLNDAIENFPINERTRREVNALFLDSIQSRELFIAVENLRKALVKIVEANIFPTIFLLRFDRFLGVVDDQFFSNLEGLVDSSGQKLAYVFTSFRKIDEIDDSLSRNFLHVFSNVHYIRCANFGDTKVIFDTFKRRYRVKVSGAEERKIIEISGGHVQYLHLAIVVLTQKNEQRKINGDILKILASDERIRLQSEEIWESLTEQEREVLLKVHRGEKIGKDFRVKAKYLWETGIVSPRQELPPRGILRLGKASKPLGGAEKLFSPLLGAYLDEKKEEKNLENDGLEFTKKENLLYNFLTSNLGEVCEREAIIEAVWPEEEEMGVSDWTIDRLAARLREKMKKQKSKYQIITVKTRGFKLTSS